MRTLPSFHRSLWAAAAALAILSCTTACAGAKPASQAPQSQGSLYDRLGGLPAITAVIDQFLGNVVADERINARFAAASVPDLRQKLIDMVCQVTGGPCTYSGRGMKAAHQGMNIKDSEFDALAGDLQAALDKFKVPAREEQELMGAVGSLRSQIVNNGAAAK